MSLAAAVAELVAARRPEQSRAPSVVVTVYGDAIVPRGGSVGLATLSAILGGLGIVDGAVRTAASRLVADGWLARRRAGRLSFFRLSGRGEAVFARATEHIYDPPAPAWDGALALHWPAAPDPPAWRAAGFGEASPGLWIAPAAGPEAPGPGLRLAAAGPAPDLAAVAARAWPGRDRGVLRGLRGDVPAAAAGRAGRHGAGARPAARPPPARAPDPRLPRVILRDPLLPPALLPADWPGFAARDLCGTLYRAVLPGSEAWLDRHGRTEDGPLPPPGPALARRFATRYTALDFKDKL